MVAPVAPQRGFRLKVPGQQEGLKRSKSAYLCGRGLHSKRRVPVVGSKGCRVVCASGFDWKPIEESIKKQLLWRGPQLSSWKYPQNDVAKIIRTIQGNTLAIYSAVIAVLGFRLSMTFGMGWTVVGACILTSCVGYILCIRQAMLQEAQEGSMPRPELGKLLLKAQDHAFQSYSYRAEATSNSKNTVLMLLSSLFEPSPVYLLLNCWAIYAIGQCVVYKAFGGGVLLMICLASLVSGRLLQRTLWRMLAPAAEPAEYLNEDTCGPTRQQTQSSSILEMLFTPKGTWGIGPIFNGVVWFGVLLLPAVDYPASPVVLAPLWTAVGAPALLLLEDIVSLVSKTRRDSKFAASMGPGLQLGSFLVGITCALAVRSMHLAAFQFW